MTNSRAHSHRIKIKKTDQTINSSTTLTNDTELFIPLSPNKVYYYTLYLHMVGDATADFKFKWDVPSGTTGKVTTGIPQGTAFTATGAIATEVNSIAHNGSAQMLKLEGFIETSSTAGNLQFTWAQNTSDAAATIVKTGSTLRLMEQS